MYSNFNVEEPISKVANKEVWENFVESVFFTCDVMVVTGCSGHCLQQIGIQINGQIQINVSDFPELFPKLFLE